MSYQYSEDGLVEAATQEVLESLGWQVVYAWKKETFGAEGLLGRENKAQVILTRYLREALKKLNPGLPEVAYNHAMDQVIEKMADKTLGHINKDKHDLLTKGVQVSFQNDKGQLEKKRLKIFNFDQPTENHFLAVRQFEVVGELYALVVGDRLRFSQAQSEFVEELRLYPDYGDQRKVRPSIRAMEISFRGCMDGETKPMETPQEIKDKVPEPWHEAFWKECFDKTLCMTGKPAIADTEDKADYQAQFIELYQKVAEHFVMEMETTACVDNGTIASLSDEADRADAQTDAPHPAWIYSNLRRACRALRSPRCVRHSIHR